MSRPRMFYLGGSDQPFTDWIWCDCVADAHISHTGWWADEFGDYCTIRGIVARLPHGRYMAGWSMGDGMSSALYPELFDDITDAARMADEHARVAADIEREIRESNDEENDECSCITR